MFYTHDHEWIDFHGITAYVGVNKSKLSGFSDLYEVSFNEFFIYKNRGEEIARIKYHDNEVAIHMPVDGSIIQVNDVFTSNDLVQISKHLDLNGWIYSIIPSDPYDRGGLITAKKYKKV